MSLHPHVIEPVPDETARVAHAAFPKGHPYLGPAGAFKQKGTVSLCMSLILIF